MRISLRWKMVASCSIPYIFVVGLSAYLILLECQVAYSASHAISPLLALGLAAALAGATTVWFVDRRIKRTLICMIETIAF